MLSTPSIVALDRRRNMEWDRKKMLRSIVNMFGGSDEKVVAKMRPDVDAINRLEPEFERLSDGRLMDRTGDFQRSLASGADIEDILPEAFAAVRESAKRTLGQRHYDVQIVGGIVLHQGKDRGDEDRRGQDAGRYTPCIPQQPDR